jgi:hypothetical protein
MACLISIYNFSLKQNYKVCLVFLAFIIYFLIMDMKLYANLQLYTPPQFDKHLPVSGVSEIRRINVFHAITCKLVMVDHITHYVHDVLAQLLEYVLHVTTIFPWITANSVSFMGLAFAICASRLILSDKIIFRRLGCLLFELRNFADSFDGVVYRSRSNRVHTYESVKGSVGYNIDATCDTLAGTLFMFAILFRYLRYMPTKCKPSTVFLFNYTTFILL